MSRLKVDKEQKLYKATSSLSEDLTATDDLIKKSHLSFFKKSIQNYCQG